MVDPVDVVLGEVLVQGRVQRLRTGQVLTEWLLHHDAGAGGTPGGRDAIGDPAEQRRRHLQVVQHLLSGPDLAGHLIVSVGGREVAVDVIEQAEHPGRCW